MEITIKNDAAIDLCDQENFREFNLVIVGPYMSDDDIVSAFAPQAEAAGNGEFWISVDYVRALAARDEDADWQRRFTGMLDAVRPYGWASEDLTRVRVHATWR